MRRAIASNISRYELANMFVNYVLNASEDMLKDTYLGDIMEEEDSEIKVGNFRLIHILKNDEYFSFFPNFYKDNEKNKLTIFSVDLEKTILECTFDDVICSWKNEIGYSSDIDGICQEIKISDITLMATKLRKIL